MSGGREGGREDVEESEREERRDGKGDMGKSFCLTTTNLAVWRR